MASVDLLITLVLVKQHWGYSSVTSCSSSVCELSALKVRISISIKTLSLQTKAHMAEAQTWFYWVPTKQLKVAGVAFLPKRLQWCLQLPASSWNSGCGLLQSGAGALEVAAELPQLHWGFPQEECQWLSEALKMLEIKRQSG